MQRSAGLASHVEVSKDRAVGDIESDRVIFDDGEPHAQKVLATISQNDIWKQLVGEGNHHNLSMPCPMTYTQQDMDGKSEKYTK